MEANVLLGKKEISKPKTLYELLHVRAQTSPAQNVYSFINGGDESSIEQLTYGELLHYANVVGGTLQDIGAQGERVILLCKPSLHYMVGFWGCIFAGSIAVPAFPPVFGRLDKTLSRIEAIMEDCQPSTILATSDVVALSNKLASKSKVFRKVKWLAIDRLKQDQASHIAEIQCKPKDIAFLQYTSGSTSTPKGVKVTHGNLIHNSHALNLAIQGANKFVSWLPPYHDMGLIGNTIQVVYGAGWGYFMAPNTFVRNPMLWLQALSRTKANVSMAPNFGYEHCVNKITDEQIKQLDLSNWKHALSGAEPVRAATLRNFGKRFKSAGFDSNAFQPSYGLAEGTLIVSGGQPLGGVRVLKLNQVDLEARKLTQVEGESDNAIESIACGKAVESTEIAIVDPETCRRCPDDSVGEIWVRSPSVAAGYWNRPDINKNIFKASIVNEKGKRYLRTGDLGFVDEDDELHISGRLKDLILLRGRNLYPNDIEYIVQKAYKDKCGKVISFAIQIDGREELVVVMEGATADKIKASELVVDTRRLLAAEPLEISPFAVLVVRSGEIPQTSSGKLQRFSARSSFLMLEFNPFFASVLSNYSGVKQQKISDPKKYIYSLLKKKNTALDFEGDSTLIELGYNFSALVNLAKKAQLECGANLFLSKVLMKPTVSQLFASLEENDTVKGEKDSNNLSIGSFQCDETTVAPKYKYTEIEIKSWLKNTLSNMLGIPSETIDLNLTYADLGLDSVGSVQLAESLSNYLGHDISETFVWDTPSLRDTIDYLVRLQRSPPQKNNKNENELVKPSSVKNLSVTRTENHRDENIAVVGIACRFPGSSDIESFWKLLQDGRDAISLVPSDRWPNHNTTTTKNGSHVCEWGGFLNQIDGFEPQFFGLSNREAQRMDPQQRLLLEVAWEAIEHSGINPKALAGTRTGVFVGIGHQEYWSLQLGNLQELDIYSCTGTSSAIASNRISYFLDLHGPSMTIDTACSGSLVGVHLACESLRRGESTIALAGGVNLMIKPDLTIAFSDAQMLSPNGRCSTFDDSADGYVRGEGCGVIVLERLSDAIRNNSPIVGVIKGSAVLHEGRSNGLTAPNPNGQEAVIKDALEMSGLSANQIDYVEAHGTGTPLGDPIEAGVLARIYGKNRKNSKPCLIGSVKTNIGHLESAAGIAGLIKTILCVERQYIPPHLNFSKPNRKVDWKNSGLKVIDKRKKWISSGSGQINAGVSSFGFGGTIAHLIVSSPPSRPTESHSCEEPIEDSDEWKLLVLSARETESLEQHILNYQQYIQSNPSRNLGDMCYTAALGRAEFSKRLTIIGRNKNEFLEVLEHKRLGLEEVTNVNQKDLGKCVFCFSGQGSQYLKMATDLVNQEPQFKEIITRCDAIVAPSLGYSLFDLLGKNTQKKLLQNTRILQPVLYALQCALAQLWMSWGVKPDIVLGHSIGEYAAMQVAGMVTLEDGMRLIDARARAMSDQPQVGGMAACVGDLTNFDDLIDEYRGRLWVAANNSLNNRVVAGETDAIISLSKKMTADITVNPLRVSNGFHSPLMQGAAVELRAAAEKITSYSKPKIAFITNLGGKLFNDKPTPSYFCEHLTKPVDFQSSINTALEMGGRNFIEIGPGRSFLNFAYTQAKSIDLKINLLPSLLEGKPERKVLLESLARYWKLGVQLDWEKFYQHKQRKRVHMPNYPFSHSKHWNESKPKRSDTPVKNIAENKTEKNVRLSSHQLSPDFIDATLDLFRSQTAFLGELAGLTSFKNQSDSVAAINSPSIEKNREPECFLPTSHANDDTFSKLAIKTKQYIASVAGCTPNNIALDDRLNTSLGLDSLMRIELDRHISAEWPQLAQQDSAALDVDPSVKELVEFIAKSQGVITQSESSKTVDQNSVINEAEKTKVTLPEINFEDSEEYKNHLTRLELMHLSGENPYGRVHQGFNGSHSILDGKSVLNFASFNYSGLSNHPEVCNAAREAISTYGTSPSATPLLFGETPLHHELEAEVASYLGTEASVIFASGHSTSVAVIGHVMGQEDLVIHDQYIHDCAIRGTILSGSKRRSFSHNNYEELDKILTKIRGYYRRVLIVIEGVYSQDGDIGNLPEFIKVKKKYQAMLMVDEAHSIGVLGETGAGVGEHFAVERRDVDIWMGTLSKGLGSCGGYIASSKNFIKYLKYTTPLLIFSTGITPANAAAALQAIRVLRKEPERVQTLQQKSKWFLDRAGDLGFDTGLSSGSPVIPIIVGSWEKSMNLSEKLRAKDINVMPIGYPAVEKDKCRLRFFVNVDHTEEEMEYALQSLKQAVFEYEDYDSPPAVIQEKQCGVSG